MIELARELGLALAHSAEFVRMKQAQSAVKDNEPISVLLAELSAKRERLLEALSADPCDNLGAVELTDDIERLEGQLQENPLLLELLSAQSAFSSVLRAVNDEINACIGGETSGDDTDGGCNGRCDGCSGCRH